MDTEETVSKFFETVYGGLKGQFVIMTRDEDGNLVSERWWSIPEELESAKIYATIRSDEDVYVSTAVFTDTVRTKEDLGATTKAVYADADTCHPDNFRITPTITVETSPGRYHAWWLLDEAVPASEASEAAHRISMAHKDQGCDNGWHVSKILRVPGTSNTKDGTTNTVTATYTDDVYTLDTINDIYGDMEIVSAVDLNRAVPKEAAQGKLAEIEKVIDEENLNSLYLEKPHEGQSWSERLFKLELELFRAGLEAEDVFIAARNSACNKYSPENAGELTETGIPIPRRNNPDKVLWQDVLKAQGEYEATRYVEVETLGSTMRKAEPKTFLTTDEKRYLKDSPTFIDEYTEWVAKRTDSAPTYQRTLAWQVLSTVFGQWGYLMPTHSTENLNLWTLILGDTCQPLDAKVLTPNGWTTLGEVRQDDHVIGRHGEAVRVRAVKQTKMDDVYKVSFRNGAEVESTLDHLWTVRVQGGKETTMTLNEVVGYVQDRVTVTAPVLGSEDTGFKSVEFSRRTEVKCISVDSDDELYVTNDFVLTHNTATRKSTALNLYLKVIRNFEDATGESFLVGSNVTQEGLTKELTDRNNKVSVIHTDEINGFFQAAFVKSYQTGLLEFFTELYDGTLQKVLRAGKDAGNRNTVSVMFNFIGVGIREKTAQVLVQEHLESGFLARMLWCVADPPPRKEGADSWQEADDDSTKFTDESLNEVVDNLVDRVRMWAGRDEPERILGTVEANARHNEWIEGTMRTIEEMGHYELLVASTKRLHVSVRKAAALLAMYEQKDTIELRHIISAIGQSEHWFNDMVRMSLEVSSTGFERSLTEVENFVLGSDNSSGVLESTIRRKFSRHKPQEQDELLRALKDQGRIRKKPESRNRWEVL